MKPNVIFQYTEEELQQAKSNGGIWLVADCDNGGVFLYSIKVASLNCHSCILQALLTVMEAIVWNRKVDSYSEPSVDAATFLTENIDLETGLPLSVNDQSPTEYDGVWIGSDANFLKFPKLTKVVCDLLRGRITVEETNPLEIMNLLIGLP